MEPIFGVSVSKSNPLSVFESGEVFEQVGGERAGLVIGPCGGGGGERAGLVTGLCGGGGGERAGLVIGLCGGGERAGLVIGLCGGGEGD